MLATVVWRRAPSSGRQGSKAIISPAGDVEGWLGGACAAPTVVRRALESLEDGKPRVLVLGEHDSREGVEVVPMACESEGAMEVYLEPVLPTPELVVVGDSPMVGALVEMAAVLGWRSRSVDSPDHRCGRRGRVRCRRHPGPLRRAGAGGSAGFTGRLHRLGCIGEAGIIGARGVAGGGRGRGVVGQGPGARRSRSGSHQPRGGGGGRAGRVGRAAGRQPVPRRPPWCSRRWQSTRSAGWRSTRRPPGSRRSTRGSPIGSARPGASGGSRRTPSSTCELDTPTQGCQLRTGSPQPWVGRSDHMGFRTSGG